MVLKNQDYLTRIASKRFSEILQDGFILFFKNWKKIILPMTLFFIMGLLVKTFLLADLNWYLYSQGSYMNALLEKFQNDPTSISNVESQALLMYLSFLLLAAISENAIDIIFTILSLSAVSFYLYNKYMNEKSDYKLNIKKALNKKVILVILLLGIGIPIGFVILIVPAIIIFGFYIFSVFTFNFDDVKKPIREARLLSKGAFWKIIAIFLISTFISMMINNIYSFILDFLWPVKQSAYISWYDPMNRRYDLIILYTIVQSIISILLQPLFISLLTTTFSQMKVKREILLKTQYITHVPTSTVQVPKVRIEGEDKSLKGIYCPYCGQYMEIKLNYCPNCGEHLDFEI